MEKLDSKNKRKVSINILMVLGAICVCIVSAFIALTTQTYDVKQGEISPETIVAPEDFVDEKGTRRLKEAAQADVGDIFVADPETSQEILKRVSADFLVLEEVRAAAEQYYYEHQKTIQQDMEDDILRAEQEQETVLKEIAKIEKQQTATLGDSTGASEESTALPQPAATLQPTPSPVPIPTSYVIPVFDAPKVPWEYMLTDAERELLQKKLPAYMDERDLLTVISMTEGEILDMSNVASKRVQQDLYNGINKENIEKLMAATCYDIVQRLRLSLAQETMLMKILEGDIDPNMVYDEKATQDAKEKAASLIPDVEYKKGQNIVLKGNVVTEEQYELLKDRMLLSSELTAKQPYYAIMIYIVLVFLMYVIYLAVFNRRLITDTKKVAILCILTALCYVLTSISQLISLNIYPIFLFVILWAVLLSPKNAVVYGVFLSLLMMSVTTNGQELISKGSLILLLNSLLGVFFAVYVLKDMRYRSKLLVAGIMAALPGAALAAMLWLYKINTLQESLISTAVMVGSGLLCGIASVGVLPIIENLFKLITPTKLLELTGPNHPLIKRLMMEAPGTYHHSMLVANLTEAACNVVGGFTLLARVGAYYHDVGKIENPLFFKENQRNNFNPHDNFMPKESAAILRKHVTDGVAMLKKYNMPEEIIDIVAQHHGNGIAAYFYAKALQEDRNANIDDFRYDGIPPQTREAAIVMLADCVEAAVRSMDNPTNKEIEHMVEKLIRERYDEGQLDYAPLNRRDLKQIAQAFINIFQGVYHQRIQYPEIKIHGVEDEDTIL